MASSELAKALGREAGAIVEQAGSRLGEAAGRPARLVELVGALRAQLDGGVPVASAPSEDELAEHDVVHDLVFELAERVQASVGELRLVSAWRQAAHARRRAVLDEDNRRLSMLLDSVEEVMILHKADDDATFLHFNRAAAEKVEQLSGRTAESLIGTRVRDFVSLPLKEREVALQLAETRAGRAVSTEVYVRMPGGGRWRETRVSPVFDAQGEVQAAALVSRDVTERKLAETRLKLLSKVSTLAEATDDEHVLEAFARIAVPELADLCVVDLVEDGQVRRAQVFHQDPAQAALAEALRAVSVHELYESEVGRAVLSGRSHLVTELDDRALCKHRAQIAGLDGDQLPRSLILVPLRVLGVTFAVAGFLVTADSERRYSAVDLAMAEELAARAATIIENTRLHNQLRERDAHLKIALAGSNVCIFEQDTELRLRWIYNWLLDEAELPLNPSLLADKRRALLSGQPTRSELPLRVRGEDRHFVVTHVPIRCATGEVIGLIGTVVDVTDEKRVQGRLSHALTFRDQVMGILGHDLRNPLAAVVGAVGLARARRDPVPPAVRRDLDQIESATRRMLELITTLLDFSEARFTDQLPISPAESDLGEIAGRVVAELRVGRPEHVIELEARGDTRGVWDGPRLAQVLSNLLGNALQHGADTAPARVTIDGEREVVRVEVHNAGPPIDPALVPRLFEPFARGEQALGPARPRGLGLGLYIAHQIVRAHDGHIAVRSSLEEGTSFSVHLPRQPEVAQTARAVAFGPR